MTHSSQEILASLLHVHELDQLYSDLTVLNDLAQAGTLETLRDANADLHELERTFMQPVHVEPLREAVREWMTAPESTDKSLASFIEDVRKQASSRVVVRLTVALAFEESDLREMAAVLAERIGQPIVFDLRIDHTMIGGAVVEYGSFSSDYSIRSRIGQFREHWKAAVADPS